MMAIIAVFERARVGLSATFTRLRILGGSGPREPNYGFATFGLGCNRLFYLHNRRFLALPLDKNGETGISTLAWAIAFLCYGLTFIGMMLQSLGVWWADSTKADIFFIYRQTMIWWIGLMYVGIASIMTKSRIKQLVPGIIFIGFGY